MFKLLKGYLQIESIIYSICITGHKIRTLSYDTHTLQTANSMFDNRYLDISIPEIISVSTGRFRRHVKSDSGESVRRSRSSASRSGVEMRAVKTLISANHYFLRLS